MENIQRGCEIKIIKIDRAERKVSFKISKAEYSDLEGLEFPVFMKSVDDMKSAELVKEAAQEKLGKLLVFFFEKGFPFEGQTFPGLE